MLLELNKLGKKNSILHRRAQMITTEELDSGLYNVFIDNMLETAESLKNPPYSCVGLASTQVWSDPNEAAPAVFLLRTYQPHSWITFINPIIQPTGRSHKEYEGCLSIPKFAHLKRRHKNVGILWMDRGQKVYQQKFSGFLARVIQHEYDHLCGKTLVKMRPLQRRKKSKK